MTIRAGNQTAKQWGRRISAVLFAISLGVLCLYVWNTLTPNNAIISLTVMHAAIAGFVGVIALVIFIWQRRGDQPRDSSMAELASKLSTTKGKSDVVISTIKDGVLSITRDGMIDLVNPAAQHLIGWNQGDALGLDWRSVLKLVNAEGREVDAQENPITKALATGEQTRCDTLFLLTSSDRKRMVSIVISPVDGVNSGVIVVVRDVTKEKAEEREMAEFISTASHEMRTPVASIEGYLGLALNPATATIDDKAREFITKAHESAQHLGRLFQDLLDVSKAEDGRLKNEPHVIDVTVAVGNAVEGLAQMAAQKQLRYIFQPNPSLETDSSERHLQPVFYADIDPDHFREVVSNLIENAIKYTPRGDIVVDVKGDDSVVTVSVADSGIGIPAEDIPHLFQKFYRVDNSDTREIGGTGLGLYLCRRLAEAMGGHLRVESEYKKGSTFYLDIPRMSHEDAMRKLQEIPDATPEIIMASQTTTPMEATIPPALEIVQPIPQPAASIPPAFTPQPVVQPMPQPVPQLVPEPVQPMPAVAAAPLPIDQLVPPTPSPQPIMPQPPASTPQASTFPNQPARVDSINVPPRM